MEESQHDPELQAIYQNDRVAMTFPKGREGNFPLPPKFPNFQAEREHLQKQLILGFRLFSKYGFDEGIAGHITVRDPEYKDHFWVNPFGLDFSEICVNDLLFCNSVGEIVEGKHPLNNAAFAIHSNIHSDRPDIVAVAHAHSIYGKTWSTLGRLLDPITQDSCAFYQDHSVFEDFTGVVTDTSEGKRIAQALGQGKACILRNHGLLTVGKTVDEAVWWFITMEKSCQCQLLAEAASNGDHRKPHIIPPDTARLTRNRVGTSYAGWFSAQPLFSRMRKKENAVETTS